MFKTKRSVIALLCALALVAAACGDDDDTAASTTTTSTTTNGGGGDDGGGGEDAACEGADPIKLALLAPMTGQSAQSAKWVENATNLAVAHVNEAGILGDRRVEVSTYDTEFLPEVATQQAQRAITQDGVHAIVGPWSTTEALAVADVAEREGVVDINNSAATPSITEGRQFIFRTSPLTPDLAAGLVDVAMALGVEKAVLLHESGGFGLGAVDPIKAAAEAAGLELTEVIQFPTNATDVSAEVARAARANPGAVLIASAGGADTGLVGKAMAEQGLIVPFIGFSPIALPDAINIAGGAYDQFPGVYTLSTSDTTNPNHIEVLEAYNAEFDEIEVLPEQALGAYDAVWWLAEGLAASACEPGEALVASLHSLPPRNGVNGRTGSEQSFSEGDHDAFDEDYLVPYKLEGGRLVQDTSLDL